MYHFEKHHDLPTDLIGSYYLRDDRMQTTIFSEIRKYIFICRHDLFYREYNNNMISNLLNIVVLNNIKPYYFDHRLKKLIKFEVFQLL